MPFLPMLEWWQWTILGLVPPAIVALYFLKLRRVPLEVPSTLLWKKTIDDLHVNSFWQRLRRNLLMYLQVFFILMLILVLLRPSWQTAVTVDDRTVLLIDNSASMGSVDLKPTRLAEAKLHAIDRIDAMGYGDVAMVISFSDSARVEQSFTGNKAELREAVERIAPTQQRTNLLEALRQAAGLANPGYTAAVSEQEEAANPNGDNSSEALPATLYILSDGRFPDVTGFSLGNLKPVFVPIGVTAPKNVAITAFSLRRNDERAEDLQAFAQIDNFGPSEVTVLAELFLDGKKWDKTSLKIAPGAQQSAVFELRGLESGTLELLLTNDDDLAADNRAFAILQAPQPLQVLLVTAGNPDLERALGTKLLTKLGNIRTQKPEYLQKPEYQQGAGAGLWDVIIYDRCSPEKMPRANTLFLGAVPPVGWSSPGIVATPQVIDLDRVHPLSQNLDFSDVLIASAQPLNPPTGATRLIESTRGTLAAVAPREGFEDCVVGIGLIGKHDDGTIGYLTNWHLRAGFPLFLQNVLSYFSRTQDVSETISAQPGTVLELRQDQAAQLNVKTPAGRMITVNRSPRNTFPFAAIDEIGVYDVFQGNQLVQRLAINLCDVLESNIVPIKAGGIRIGYNEVPPETAWHAGRNEFWKWILLAALVLLLAEWVIYNKRIF